MHLDTLSGVMAITLIVATLVAKVGATRMIQLSHVRLRSLERQRETLRHQLSTLAGESELARREHRRVAADAEALRLELWQTNNQVEDLTEKEERRNRRLAQRVRHEVAPHELVAV